MNAAYIRFYEELNDFLDISRRKKEYRVFFELKRTVKDLIEGEGVPHVEVDLILVNGVSVGFDHHVLDGDRISVYPEFELLDISPVTRLRPQPLRRTRFIADANLGRLARYLRMTGFDTLFDINLDDGDIIRIAREEKRIILTRDMGILKNGMVSRGYFIRNQQPDRQLAEVVKKFDLKRRFKPFIRCIVCNGNILPVNREDVVDQLPEQVQSDFSEFFRCDHCGRIYWKGSHYERMLEKIGRL